MKLKEINNDNQELIKEEFINLLKVNFIHYLRHQNKYTLRHLADLSGISHTAVADFENTNRPFSESIFRKLLDAFNVQFDDTIEHYKNALDDFNHLIDQWLLVDDQIDSKIDSFLHQYNNLNSLSFYLTLTIRYLQAHLKQKVNIKKYKHIADLYDRIFSCNPSGYILIHVLHIMDLLFSKVNDDLSSDIFKLDSSISLNDIIAFDDKSNIHLGLIACYLREKSRFEYQTIGLKALKILEKSNELFMTGGYIRNYIVNIGVRIEIYTQSGLNKSISLWYERAKRLACQCHWEYLINIIEVNIAYYYLMSANYQKAFFISNQLINKDSKIPLVFFTQILSEFFLGESKYELENQLTIIESLNDEQTLSEKFIAKLLKIYINGSIDDLNHAISSFSYATDKYYVKDALISRVQDEIRNRLSTKN